MVTINGKDVVFETRLILRPGEVAVIPNVGGNGFNIKFHVGAANVMPTDVNELSMTFVGDDATSNVPFLPGNYTMSRSDELTFMGRTFGSLIAAHGVGDMMVLHLQIHVER